MCVCVYVCMYVCKSRYTCICAYTHTRREREREDSGLRCDTLCMLYVCSRPSATELNAGEYWAKVRVQNPLKVERRVATSGWRFVPEIRLKRFWGSDPKLMLMF